MTHDVSDTALRGERVVLRPLDESDIPEMLRLLAEPEISMWWGTHDEERVRREMLADTRVHAYAIVADGRTAGSIMWHEEDEPDYKRAGMDIFVDSAARGTGIALDALATVARYLFDTRQHHAIDIDPHVDNARAIRAYEKVGFKPVGVRRRYERGDDGTWHDNLLMDLIPEELVPASAC
jgi:aminoglycoside 6'-N-acetyltransferase